MSDPLRPRVIEVDEREAAAPRAAGPRVIEVDEREAAAPRAAGPRVIETERTGPIVPAEPARVPTPLAPAPRRKSRAISLGLMGLGVAFAGWMAVDAYGWVASAFERSIALGSLAAVAVAAGVLGAAA